MLQPILQIVLSAIAIYLTTLIVPGVNLVEPWTIWHLLLIGLIFGLLNSVIKPIVVLLSLPLLVVTLGLFYFVINALILWLTGAVFDTFAVNGFWAALFGSIIITIINWALNIFFGVNTVEHQRIR